MKLAMYLRLSKEDGNDESNSIKNQRIMIKEFIFSHKDLRKYDCIEFKDDGISGKREDRPGFERMISMVKSGEIKCVIVKDMSRFSRDQILCGKYREQIFPFMGVRFIAINDDYDSSRTVGGIGGIDIAFKEILYDMYSEDISEKVKSSLDSRRADGKYIATSPPYGYRKSEVDKYQLVIDEPAANIVRRIFKEYLDGKSIYAIRKTLNAEQIPCPSKYLYDKGLSKLHSNNIENAVWTTTSVSRILHNPIYIGTITYGKSKAISTGSRKKKNIIKDEWKSVENCHEAMIKKKDFEKVQEMLEQNKRFGSAVVDTAGGETVIKHPGGLNKLYCKGCGRKLIYDRRGKSKYYCPARYEDKPSDCCVSLIYEDDIKNIISSRLKAYIDQNVDIGDLHIGENNLISVDISNIKQVINNLYNKITILKEDLKRAYEDYRSGVLSKEAYLEKRKNNEALLKEYDSQIYELENEKKTLVKNEKKLKSDIARIGSAELIDEVDERLEDIFIEKVVISKDNEVEILWKFRSGIKVVKDL